MSLNFLKPALQSILDGWKNNDLKAVGLAIISAAATLHTCDDDCYVKAEADEPIFVLLARDVQAPLLVRQWAERRAQLVALGLKPESDMDAVEEARWCADQMALWHAKHRPKTTEPQTPATDCPAGALACNDPACTKHHPWP